MQCEQFEARWQQLLDDRLPVGSDPYLLAHSLTCESCAALVESTESLLYGLEYDCDVDELGDDFAERVVAAACKSDWYDVDQSSAVDHPTRKSRGGWSFGWTPLAIAAAAAVWMLLASLQPNPQTTPVALDLPSPTQTVVIGAENGAVADEQELAIQEMQALLIELAGKFPKDEAAKMLSDHMQRLDNVARPVANSVGTAITAIYRSVGSNPPDKSAQKLISMVPIA